MGGFTRSIKCISDCDHLIAVTNTFQIVSDALSVAIWREQWKMEPAAGHDLDGIRFLGKSKALCGTRPQRASVFVIHCAVGP